jgi:hypothetical protein
MQTDSEKFLNASHIMLDRVTEKLKKLETEKDHDKWKKGWAELDKMLDQAFLFLQAHYATKNKTATQNPT